MTVRLLARALVAAGAALAVAAGAPTTTAAATEGQTPVGDVRHAVFVGNNWEGTVDIIAPGTFKRLGRINMIPDQDERMMEIATNPERLAYYLAIREAIGEGHDQLVDDMYTSNDGRLLIASRPSYADVVAISLETFEIVWRTPVAGQRSDHMAISPDGTRVAQFLRIARQNGEAVWRGLWQRPFARGAANRRAVEYVRIEKKRLL